MTRFAMCKCGSISTYTPQSYLYRLNATEHGSMPTHAAQSYLIQPNSTVHSSMPTHAAQSYLIRPNATVHGSMPTHAAQSYLIRPQCHSTRFNADSCGSKLPYTAPMPPYTVPSFLIGSMRQLYSENRSLTVAFRRDCSAVCRDDLFGYGEAESCAAAVCGAGRVEPVKLFENCIYFL